LSAPTVHLQLECELPRELVVGTGTALFVCGWCFCPDAWIRSLTFLVDGERQPVIAHGMPRLDPFRNLHPGLDPFAADGIDTDPASPEDPQLRAYRSGFWGIARIAGGRPGRECELLLDAELDTGGHVAVELARIRLLAGPDPTPVSWPDEASGPKIAICMATYNPPADLLERQLRSIRGQSHYNWVCLISDDCSSEQAYSLLEDAARDEPRFIVSRSPKRLGFYRNFERALAMVPRDADLVALSDQDDLWHSDKLQTLIARIGRAQLVYSDARVVSRQGELISDTWWSTRRNNHSSLLSLLVANSVTGAASLFPRDLLDYALPFPPAQFAHFHDHWLGLVALSVGDIEFVDRPLYDYVQHGAASLGHAAANQMPALRDRLLHRRALSDRVRMWRLHYFVDVCRLLQFATILEMRCSPRMTAGKRRVLDGFLRTDRSLLSLARLGLRGARELAGRRETLGAEWMLFHAFGWRRLLARSARDRPQRRLRLDALPPPTLVQPPGRTGMHESARAVGDKIAPLRWSVSDDAPARVNLLIPTLDLKHFFGGYIAKLNLARRLVEHGLRVRIVTVDPVGPLPGDWKARVESYGGLAGPFQHVEVTFGRESAGIELSRSDSFIATTWWTAHIANRALEDVYAESFLYLIQEYEPFTFPMGTYAALASQSYRFPHYALFSSELLRDYFRIHGLGVYDGDRAYGDQASAAFQNAITPVDAPVAGELERRRAHRLLFYARPEPHAARNMFELGVLALAGAHESGTFGGEWELYGIGTVEHGRSISLGNGAHLELLPRADQRSYAARLRDHDVGLALMYTPHPSLVPIEMASAGMLTVTNSFENKTAEAMTSISSNLITVEPSVEGIAAGLQLAVAAVSEIDRRIAASAVRWSRDWNDSFDDKLLERLASVLQRRDALAV
jgi:glycosyltransferase involved in cell wall biosynthesis